MPKKIINITDEPHQKHTLKISVGEVILSMRFIPIMQMWVFDAEYKGVKYAGVRASVASPHFESYNLPFDFKIIDSSGLGVDPVRADDFSTDRCLLYLLDDVDMEAVRGVKVPI